MKLRFSSIDIESFKAIERLTFKLERGPGLHYLSGRNVLHPRLDSNGCCKSSIFSALCWCLYGKTEDGLRGSDVVPWGGGRPLVAVTLYRDQQKHVVERMLSPNRLLLDSSDAGQEQIEKLLGMNYNTFTNTILMGQARPLFFDLPPAGKLKLFEEVLELERWEERSFKAKKAADKLQAECQVEKGFIDGLEHALHENNKHYSVLKQKAEDWEQELQRRLTAIDAELADASKRLKPLRERYDQAQLDYDGALTEVEPLRREIDQQQDYRVIQQRELARLELAAENADKLKGGVCPTCGQNVDKAGSHDHSTLKLARANLKDIEQQLQRAQAGLAEFNRRAATARAVIDQSQVAVAALQQKVSMLTDRRASESAAGNPLSEQVGALRQQISASKSELKRRTDDWRNKLAKAHDSEFWVKGFRDIKLNIIEETLDELELTANAMLEQVGLVGWELQFDVERESKSGTLVRGLNVLIQSPYNNDAVKWECWSGGEGQRLRVLGALALGAVLLNRAGVETQLEILDEPGSHISPLGIQDLVDMLAERARLLGRVIFFVDQNVVQSAKFASSTIVVRERDGIRCEQS